ncbi:MAG: serine/threonine-protein kinase [Antricoccus sp.]
MNLSRHDAIWLPTPSGTDDFLGPYRIVRKVGSGGMGIVYLGADPTDKPVALKVLRDHIAEDTSARARLRRELEVLRRVRHRSVAGIVDADLDNERPYIVTEFISGPQLDTYVDQVGPLARAGLVNLGHGLIGALEAIHDVGVIHRDLKPGNILLYEARPVVIDFGIAQLADDIRLTMTGLFVGTPGYVAPEVIDGAHCTPATDWWGWAATMAFVATGRPPAGRGPIEVVLDRIRRGAYDLAGVDADLLPLIVDCLGGDPADRPDARQIRTRFAAYAAGRATTAPMVHHRPNNQVVSQRMNSTSPTDEEMTGQLTVVGDNRPVTALLHQPPPQHSLPHQPSAQQQDLIASPSRSSQPHQAPETNHEVPRPSSGRRSGTICAYGLFLVALTVTTPFAGIALTYCSVALTLFISGVLRNHERYKSRDRPAALGVVRAILTSPLRLCSSAVLGLLLLIVPGLVGGALVLATASALPVAGTTLARYSQSCAFAVGMVTGLLALWALNRSIRRAALRTAAAIVPSRISAIIAATLLLTATLIIAVLVIGFPAVNWWPLSGEPALWRSVR